MRFQRPQRQMDQIRGLLALIWASDIHRTSSYTNSSVVLYIKTIGLSHLPIWQIRYSRIETRTTLNNGSGWSRLWQLWLQWYTFSAKKQAVPEQVHDHNARGHNDQELLEFNEIRGQLFANEVLSSTTNNAFCEKLEEGQLVVYHWFFVVPGSVPLGKKATSMEDCWCDSDNDRYKVIPWSQYRSQEVFRRDVFFRLGKPPFLQKCRMVANKRQKRTWTRLPNVR